MPELLKVLKELKINARQSAGPSYSNTAHVKLSFPRRRLNLNVTRSIQDSGHEGHSS